MKTEIMRAIKAELTYEELHALYRKLTGRFGEQKGHYYYPDIFVDVCMKRMRDEIDDEYFKTWLIILCNLLNDDSDHCDLGDMFDGASFDDSYDAKSCRSMIASIRDHDLFFKHPDIVRYHRRQNMKVIYLRYEYCNSEGENIYKCYIVDHGKRIYDLKMIDSSEPDYDLSKTYCYMFDEEHLADIKRQENDDSVDCIDMSKPEKQFCKTEEDLIDLIHESYKRDRSLAL